MTTSKRELSATEKLEKKFGRLTFAAVLSSWRTTEEYSQTAFAKKLGLSVQNLNDLEKGRRIPSPTRAAKIARKLELPEIAFIQLALRDALYREGLHYKVSLETA
jgi:transcriptional regulator with XRE-family HTH domain